MAWKIHAVVEYAQHVDRAGNFGLKDDKVPPFTPLSRDVKCPDFWPKFIAGFCA